MTIRSSKRCGLSVAIDASKNAQVSMDGIPNYEMPQRFVEEEFVRYMDVDEICGWTTSGCTWHREIWWWNNEADNAVNEKGNAWKQWKNGGTKEEHLKAQKAAKTALYFAERDAQTEQFASITSDKY